MRWIGFLPVKAPNPKDGISSLQIRRITSTIPPARQTQSAGRLLSGTGAPKLQAFPSPNPRAQSNCSLWVYRLRSMGPKLPKSWPMPASPFLSGRIVFRPPSPRRFRRAFRRRQCGPPRPRIQHPPPPIGPGGRPRTPPRYTPGHRGAGIDTPQKDRDISKLASLLTKLFTIEHPNGLWYCE